MYPRVFWHKAKCPICNIENVFGRTNNGLLSTNDFGSVCNHFNLIAFEENNSVSVGFVQQAGR